MSAINSALNLATPQNYNIDQILFATQTPKQPGGFRRVLGSVIGGVGNIMMPGIGGLIGGAIGGGGMMGDAMGYLQLQRQVNMEQEMIETASAVMKARHDAAMSSIRNMT